MSTVKVYISGVRTVIQVLPGSSGPENEMTEAKKLDAQIRLFESDYRWRSVLKKVESGGNEANWQLKIQQRIQRFPITEMNEIAGING